jgi:dienelactone hydrolase
VLDLFPGRTESDLYVWVSRHRKELSERYGEQVSLRDAVVRLAETQQKPSALERVVQWVASPVVGLVQSLASDHEGQPEPELSPLPGEDEPLGRLLAQVRATVPQLAYSGQRGDEWRWWRGELRGKVWELLGMAYEATEHVETEVVETSLISGVERQKILLTAADGLILPAYVMRPVDLPDSAPALLVYPGHGTIRQTAGLDRGPHRANALALAQAGYVTISVEERGFGELNQVDHTALDNIARILGRTWLAMTLEDGLRALDYLQARPDVKPTHLGVTGLGIGGALALYSAALDERLRAVVIQNYLTSSIDPAALEDACDLVPNLRRYAGLSDVARLAVPRPVLYVYPKDRASTALARSFFDRMRPSYEVFRCPDRTRFVEHDHGEEFVGELAQTWFDRWLMEEEDTSVLLWAIAE